jgi:hypothetical protein
MRVAVLFLGLWLAGAQGFAAYACCSEMPAPEKSSCDGCGNEGERDTSPRPDCCTSLEAQKDAELAVPRTAIPQTPVLVELLSDDGSFAAWRPESADLIEVQAVSQAEGPPLYLRYQVLLI